MELKEESKKPENLQGDGHISEVIAKILNNLQAEFSHFDDQLKALDSTVVSDVSSALLEIHLS